MVLLFDSMSGDSAAALMAGIIFILNGIIDIIILYRLSKIGKKYALEMKDVFDEVNGNIIDE